MQLAVASISVLASLATNTYGSKSTLSSIRSHFVFLRFLFRVIILFFFTHISADLAVFHPFHSISSWFSEFPFFFIGWPASTCVYSMPLDGCMCVRAIFAVNTSAFTGWVPLCLAIGHDYRKKPEASRHWLFRLALRVPFAPYFIFGIPFCVEEMNNLDDPSSDIADR